MRAEVVYEFCVAGYDVPFLGLLEDVTQLGENIFEVVQTVIWDPCIFLRYCGALKLDVIESLW